jgi:hypothetical protein
MKECGFLALAGVVSKTAFILGRAISREELFQLHSRLFQLQLGTPINLKPPYKLV